MILSFLVEAPRRTGLSGLLFVASACASHAGAGPDAAVLSSADLCKAGYYEGAFKGNYHPSVFGLGGDSSGFALMIAGAPFMGRPPLSLTLEEVDKGPAGEFHAYEVRGGCMTGVAHAIGTDNPFVARLDGTLDCATGSFVGTLTGRYTLLNSMGLDFEFHGPLTAQFVLPASLKSGTWAVAEPDAGGVTGGGDGGWSADWKADQAPNVGGDPCAVLSVSDGGAPGPSDAAGSTGGSALPMSDAASPVDAGVPTSDASTPADAGG